MFTSSVIARAKVALQGSETEQRIAVLLYDDSVQVISSFELNQLASLSYHESTVLTSSRNDMVEILLDHVEQITSQPINYSIMSVQKALVVTKHLLLHGAEKVIPAIQQQLGRHIDMLRQYNTVLAVAQQQSTTAWLMRMKGGGVDTAGPVRQIAEQIVHMLRSPQQLQFERNTNADPNSLVPVGDRQQIAFITDEVRYAQLKLRIQQEQTIQMKSNLKKANDGFGGGYMSTNGKTVVGAAHGIEEMMQQKHKEERRFVDELSSTTNQYKQNQNNTFTSGDEFSEYVAPGSGVYLQQHASAPQCVVAPTPQQQPQLLSNPSEVPDLLSMDHHQYSTRAMPKMLEQSTTIDLLDLGGCTDSNLHYHNNNPNQQQHQHLYSHSSDPFHTSGTASSGIDPFGAVTPITSTPLTQTESAPIQSSSMMNMNATVDRFAALDALVVGDGTIGSSRTNTSGHSILQSKTPTSNVFSDLVGNFGNSNSTTTSTTTAPYNHSIPPLHMSQPQLYQPTVPNSSSNYVSTAFATIPTTATTALTSLSSSLQVSQFQTPFGNSNNTDESDNGLFLMGGPTGTGLIPTGHAPASAPPPPPPLPSFY
jgi:ENTH domain